MLYYITQVRKDETGEISHIRVHEMGPDGLRAGVPWSRSLIYDYLKQGLEFVAYNKKTLEKGASLRMDFTTGAEPEAWDHLENLPGC